MSAPRADVSAVVVDYHAGPALVECIHSLHDNGVRDIVVVDNASPSAAKVPLEGLDVRVVQPGINLGYGRGVNRGAAVATSATYLVVSNPDVIVHPGAVATLTSFLDQHPEVGIVGPTIVDPDGAVYPSQRVFPDVWLAGVHALLAPLWPGNPATRRYRSPRRNGTVDWVSGAFFVIRREVFERVGGFDERYFMFAEDMALCWQVRELGYTVSATDDAVVTHIEGLSRAGASRAMLIAHHRSALRFEWQTARGIRRLLAPLASLVLGLRLFSVLVSSRRAGEDVQRPG